jgi:hypothetical protein
MGQSLGLKMHPSTTSARQLGASGDGRGGMELTCSRVMTV